MSLLSAWALCLCVGSDIDVLAAAFTLGKEHYTVNKSVDGMILAHAYVFTRMVHCTALALDDVACFSVLATKNLNTESFAFRLTSVLRTTYTFLMCHFFKILMG